jgi:hypothetical protein
MNTLAAKVVKASHEVGALATDKKNPQGNYDYISSDKILQRAGDALANNGLSLVPSITSANVEAYRTNEGSKPYWCANVSMVMTLSDGETTLEYPWHGMGTDYTVADKAFFKAITGGHKYFLMKLLNIGVGNEDGEHESPPSEQQNGGAQHTTKPTAAAVANGTATGKSNGSSPAKASNGPKVPDKSNAFKAFQVRGAELFGDEWESARHWLIERYTTKETPDKVRRSSNELTDVELNALRTNMDKYATGIVKAWREYHDVPAMADVPEMQPA